MTIAYVIEGGDADSKNYELNVARHSFFCSMRFRDIAAEWGLLRVHFIWSGLLTIIFCVASWLEIGVVVQNAKNFRANPTTGSAKASSMASATRNRLLRISFMSCMCLLMNTATTVSVSVVLGEWSRSSDIWLACSISEEIYLHAKLVELWFARRPVSTLKIDLQSYVALLPH